MSRIEPPEMLMLNADSLLLTLQDCWAILGSPHPAIVAALILGGLLVWALGCAALNASFTWAWRSVRGQSAQLHRTETPRAARVAVLPLGVRSLRAEQAA